MNLFSSARWVNLLPVAGAAAGSRPTYLGDVFISELVVVCFSVLCEAVSMLTYLFPHYIHCIYVYYIEVRFFL